MKVSDEVLLDGGGPKPRDRVLIRHRRGETQTQRRSHMEAEAQGRTPRTPKSQKRRGGPSPGASAGSSALGPPSSDVWYPGLGVSGARDLGSLVPGTRGAGGMDVCGSKPQVSSVTTDAGSSRRLQQSQVLLDDGNDSSFSGRRTVHEMKVLLDDLSSRASRNGTSHHSQDPCWWESGMLGLTRPRVLV